jgi:YggT family protein
MDSSYFTNPLVFLVHTLFGLYELVVLLRFLLQYVQADFYNPISQFVVKASSPPLRPLRRMIPAYGRIDTASLVLLWLLKALELALVLLLQDSSFSPLGALFWAIPELVALVINFYLFAVFIQVIFSWINPDGYSPPLALLHRLTAPLLEPARRLIPPIGGLDLSPMVVIIALVLLEMLLLPPLHQLTGSPFR